MGVDQRQPREVRCMYWQYACDTTYLVVDQTPLLKEGMDSHDGANITSQVSTASRYCQILDGVQSVGIDHKVAIVFVDSGGFASVAVVEELGHGLAFDVVNRVHVEPGTIARQDNRMCLGNEMLASSRLDGLLRLRVLAIGSWSSISTSSILGVVRRVVHLFVNAACGFSWRSIGRIKRIIRNSTWSRCGAVLFNVGFVSKSLGHLDI